MYYTMSWVDEVVQAVGFQWDGGNTAKSSGKHGVSCEEAEQIFFNQPLLLVDDFKHSGNEVRAKAFGKTNEGRLLTVSFTMRARLIRIISARPMHRKEKKAYRAGH